VVPPGKTSVHLRIDADVLAWFKAQGRGHLTRMNAVLHAYMDAHKSKVRQPALCPRTLANNRMEKVPDTFLVTMTPAATQNEQPPLARSKNLPHGSCIARALLTFTHAWTAHTARRCHAGKSRQ
jgi:hypothetical protein